MTATRPPVPAPDEQGGYVLPATAAGAWSLRHGQAPSDQITMERPGQPWEPAPGPVLCAMEAARLYALDPGEAIAVVLLAGDDLRVALAAVRLLSAAIEGLDRVNGAVNLVERP